MYHFTKLESISKKGSFALLIIKRRITFVAFFLFISLLSFTIQKANAQAAGDYRSIINGGLPVTVFCCAVPNKWMARERNSKPNGRNRFFITSSFKFEIIIVLLINYRS